MEPEKKSNGALIGLVIIIIILVIGGIYIWQSQITTDKNSKPLDAQSENITDQDATALNALEQEISVTDIDVGANAINSIQ